MLTVVAIGNPILDCIIKISDPFLLKKYNLPLDGQKEVSSDVITSIRKDIKQCDNISKYIAGGCEQNILRIFHWLQKGSSNAIMFGGVGNDLEAELLKGEIEKEGIVTRYAKLEEYRTSTVIVFVYKENRSTVAHLSAACMYRKYHLNTQDFETIRRADIIIMCGFFAYHSPILYLELVEYKERDYILLFNIGSTYIFEESNSVARLCELSDIVIGNRREFEKLANSADLQGNNITDLLRLFHEKMLKNINNKVKFDFMSNFRKIIVVTDNKNPIYCVFGDGEIVVHEVSPIKCSEIIDTTGAGDAFSAGFIYGIFNLHDIQTSLRIGTKVAREIIKEQGVVLPDVATETFLE